MILPELPFELLPPAGRQRAVLDLLRLLKPHEAKNFRKVRVGSAGDGGYVQLDDIKSVVHALSFGVGDNDSWDLAMAKRGIPVEQFDHTIDRAPSSHARLRFHRKRVAVAPAAGLITLPELIKQHSMGEVPDLLLNCDIEGSEWDVLDAASTEDIGRFTQIVCEFHELWKLSLPDFFVKARRVISKLHERHAVVHVHGNNFRGFVNVYNISLPDVLEVTFANRQRYSLAESRERFPTPLDHPNDPSNPDIHLGAFLF